ncbi:MAG: hypothetical protein Q4F66_11130 [Clostridium sp.]|nr:hypothetical protein [Clostridium sp.]
MARTKGIDSVEPNLSTKIFGERYASPIMMPAFSHLNKVGKDGVVKKVKRMNEELSELMIYTGIKDTMSFDSSVLYMG